MYLLSIGLILTALTSASAYDFLKLFYYNDCEGKDAANYTLLGGQNVDDCVSNEGSTGWDQLIQRSANGDLAVMGLTLLARSVYPAGSYNQAERLFFVGGGPLAGKYIYEKKIYLIKSYLKKCSSVLGYSYTTSKSAVLLISDRLDINVLISPTGGYEVFKKGCTTVCNGYGYWV